MFEIFKYSFMDRAFAAGMMIAVVAPLIGNFLVIKRFSLIADTLAHLALAGVAIGLLTNTQPLSATIVLTAVAAIGIERLRATKDIPADAVLAMFLPGGLALAIVLISFANGFNVDLFTYLFGSIMTVKESEIRLIMGMGIATVIVILLLYKKLLYASFDEESARASGVPVEPVNIILIVLTAIAVSLAMRVVGILLVGALMVIPVVTAMQLGRSFLQGMFLSVFFALTAVIAGLFIAYYLNVPAGGAIVLLSLIIFGMIALINVRRRS
jgi:zinc transport system permease protein